MQQTWQSIISSDLLKDMIGLVTTLVGTFGNLYTIVALVGTGFAMWKGAALLQFFKDMKPAINAAIASMRTYIFMENGAIVSTITLNGVVNALKVSLMALWENNPIGLVVLGVTTIIGLFDMWNATQEESKRITQEHSDKLKAETTTLKDLTSQYDELSKSGLKDKDTKDKLLAIQKQLISSYDNETKGIDLANGKYEEQIKIINALTLAKQKEQIRATEGAKLEADKYLKTPQFTIPNIPINIRPEVRKEAIDASNKALFATPEVTQKAYSSLIDLMSKKNDLSKDEKKFLSELSVKYAKLTDDINKNKQTIEDYNKTAFEVDFAPQLAEMSKMYSEGNAKGVTDLYKNMTDLASSMGKTAEYAPLISEFMIGLSGDMDKLSASTISANKAIASVNATFKDVTSLESVYNTLEKGEQLTQEQLTTLIDTYPTIMDYINKTGDMSLDSGNIIKDLIGVRKEEALVTLKAEKDKNDAALTGYNNQKNMIINSIQLFAKMASATFQTGNVSIEMSKAIGDAALGNFNKLKSVEQTIAETIASGNKIEAMIKAVGSYKLSNKKSSSSDASALNEASTALLKDRYAQLNNELATTESLLAAIDAQQEKYKDNIEYQEKYNSLLKEEELLLKQKQTNVHNIADAYRAERAELVGTLSAQGGKFTGTGESMSLGNFEARETELRSWVDTRRNDKNKTTYNKRKQVYEDFVAEAKRFNELQNSIIDSGTKWWEIEQDINKLWSERSKELASTLQSEMQKRLEMVKEEYDMQISKINTLIDLNQKYFDLTNSIADEQSNITNELENSKQNVEFMDEVLRNTIFNEDDYKILYDKLAGISDEATSLFTDYQTKVNSLNEDTLYQLESITGEYQRQYDIKMKEYDLLKQQLLVQQAQSELDYVTTQKTARVWTGSKWENMANPQDVLNAQKKLQEAQLNESKAQRTVKQQNILDKLTQDRDKLSDTMKFTTQTWEGVIKQLEEPTRAFTDLIRDITQNGLSNLKNALDNLGINTGSAQGNTILDQMKSNAAAYGNADKNERLRLSQMNEALGTLLGLKRDQYGVWHNAMGERAYDSGGLATGKGIMFKNTIEPERVLSPEQTKVFDKVMNGDISSKFGSFRPIELATKNNMTNNMNTKQNSDITIQNMTVVTNNAQDLMNQLKRMTRSR